MSYAIVGFGKSGQGLAPSLDGQNIEVNVSRRRGET